MSTRRGILGLIGLAPLAALPRGQAAQAADALNTTMGFGGGMHHLRDVGPPCAPASSLYESPAYVAASMVREQRERAARFHERRLGRLQSMSHAARYAYGEAVWEKAREQSKLLDKIAQQFFAGGRAL